MSKLVFPTALKELRIHLSQSGKQSDAVRKFIKNSYPSLKAANKTTPILIREALDIKPVAYARFDKGREVKALLDSEDVEGTLKALIEKSV